MIDNVDLDTVNWDDSKTCKVKVSKYYNKLITKKTMEPFVESIDLTVHNAFDFSSIQRVL